MKRYEATINGHYPCIVEVDLKGMNILIVGHTGARQSVLLHNETDAPLPTNTEKGNML